MMGIVVALVRVQVSKGVVSRVAKREGERKAEEYRLLEEDRIRRTAIRLLVATVEGKRCVMDKERTT